MAPPPTSNAQSQTIQISLDVLDYIVTFLRSDLEALLACSKAHPDLFSIAGRYLYRHITIPTSPTSPDFRTTVDHSYCLEPSHLIELLSETPQFVNHVRILRLVCPEAFDVDALKIHDYEDIAQILPFFTSLECILLTGGDDSSWREVPRALKTAIEESFNLPTLREVHIEFMGFPLCLLNHSTNITRLRLSGSPQMPDYPNDADIYLQLESLILEEIDHPSDWGFAWNWAKRRIPKLQSLQCDLNCSGEKLILEALETCSGTLNELNLRVESESYYYKHHDLNTGEVLYSSTPMPSINISSLPRLQHLTLRVAAGYDCSSFYTGDSDSNVQEFCVTSLPSAIEILKTAPPLRHLTIEISILGNRVWPNFDISSLANALAESESFPHIDLHITNTAYDAIISKLVQYEGLKKWIEQGVLIIHARGIEGGGFSTGHRGT